MEPRILLLVAALAWLVVAPNRLAQLGSLETGSLEMGSLAMGSLGMGSLGMGSLEMGALALVEMEMGIQSLPAAR